MPLELERKFEVDKETKNTLRYSEKVSGQPPAMGTLYIQKWALPENPPKTITVKVQESE